MNTAAQAGADSKKTVQVITEEDLLKGLREVAGIKPAADEPVTVEVVVQGAPKVPATASVIEAKGTETLQKALEVSGVLGEVVELIGQHVDTSLGTLQKSLQASAERGNAIVGALVELKKSIDANTEAVKAFGAKPGAAAGAAPAGSTVILQKSVTGSEAGEGVETQMSPGALRKNIADGLYKLGKSFPAGSQEANQWARKATIFESANTISDADMREALKASGVSPVTAKA